jgi:carbamoyltransferase
MLKDNQIVGICQDNLEVGPRALGNRSILCNASNPKMKDRLNATVKFREWFRPFAPACRLEDAHKYFETTSFQHMDCMQFVAHVKEEYQAQLSSITHFDNTARLQVVTEENKRFYDILTAFDGVLINTSFNVQGKPILNSIQEALHVLDNTGLDAVIILHEGTYYKFT